ncbi:MAG TPA: dienelactone hydrolase family protein [Pyrinomonadaceae bacterium]|jgi:carboxymethylenebutenolidase
MCIGDECDDVNDSRRSFLGNAAAAVVGASIASSNATGQQQPQPQTPLPPLEPKALDDASVTHGSISFKSGAVTMQGYLARPKTDGRFRAVVIFSPNPGLTEDLRNTAAQLAQGGFIGLAINPYSREPNLTNTQARERFDFYGSKAFDQQQRRDVLAGLDYLRRQSFFRRGAIGAVGFCGGGRQALIFSTQYRELAAVVNFYAPPVLGPNHQAPRGAFKLDVMDVLDEIKAPVQSHYGAADPIIPLADVQRFERDLKAQGTPMELYIYEGAAHAFYDYTRPRFHPEAARLAHGRMIQFLKKHLS